MKAPARLGLYGLVLVAVFAVAGFTANAVVPEETVQSWAEDTADTTHHEEGDAMNGDEHEGHNAGASSLGLGLAQDGYQLTAVTAPTATGTEGELALTITGSDGNPVTDFELEHEKELHLIAVRADGQHFRHVHPEMDDDGTWTIPWQWEAAARTESSRTLFRPTPGRASRSRPRCRWLATTSLHRRPGRSPRPPSTVSTLQ